MKNLLLITGLLIVLAFKPEQGYVLTGKVTGLADSTWLYLRTSTPDHKIDSAQVMGGKFVMRGHINTGAEQVIIFTAKYTNYVHFWLENKPISLTLAAGAFKKGTVSGSATEEEDKKLGLLSTPFYRAADSLERVLAKTKDSMERKNLVIKIRGFNEQGKNAEKQWVSDYPNSIISANVLNIYATTWGRETTLALYNKLSPAMKATRYGKEINDYLLLNKGLKLGDHFVDFEQLNAAGKPVKLSSVKGKYILLDFWASLCGPCREENPRLVQTYLRYKDKGFGILSVSLDENKAAWLTAVKKDGLLWENVCDLRGDKNKAALIYGISAIPNNFLIDEHGVIVAKDLRGQALDDQLAALLK